MAEKRLPFRDLTGLGERLREVRKAKGVTLKQVAEELSVSYPSVARWEKGGSEPPLEYLLYAVRELGAASIDWLFTGEDETGQAPPFRVAENQSESAPAHQVQTFETLADVRSWEKSRAEVPPDPAIGALLTKARMVLESAGVFAEALAKNVVAFHQAVAVADNKPKSTRLVIVNCLTCNTPSEQPLARVIDDQPMFCPACGSRVCPDPQIVEGLIRVAEQYRESLKVKLNLERDSESEAD